MNTSSSSLSKSATTGCTNHNTTVLDETFDDACDAGQFCMNPCWYLYVLLEKASRRRKEQRAKNKRKSSHHHQHTTKDNDDDANHNHEDKDVAFNGAAERTRKTKFLSMIQQSVYVMCFYVVWAVVVIYIYPQIRASTHISNVHTVIGNILFGFSMASYCWVKMLWSNPGTITQETMSKFDNYQYDNVLYMSNNNICPTLGIRKLARSKYDRFSQTHVPRFDHYCTWLGTSIGEENYRFF
jgi:DHHC palmitoyltransferase